MLKSYLSAKGISTYRLAKESHIPYSTLNDLVNHKLPVENFKSGQLRAIADILSLDMNTLYDMCVFHSVIVSKKYNVQASISVEHKTYYLSFERYGRTFKSEILPVRQEATAYLDTLALWKLNEVLDELEVEAAYETIYS